VIIAQRADHLAHLAALKKAKKIKIITLLPQRLKEDKLIKISNAWPVYSARHFFVYTGTVIV
jgi:hypothetical protein